jgi:hypothetical protein
LFPTFAAALASAYVFVSYVYDFRFYARFCKFRCHKRNARACNPVFARATVESYYFHNLLLNRYKLRPLSPARKKINKPAPPRPPAGFKNIKEARR